MTSQTVERQKIIADAFDRFGPDFAAWPDRILAAKAREAILADRALHAHREDAIYLAESLAGVRASLDAEIASSEAAARVTAALAVRISPRPVRTPWVAVAAALVLSAGLGSFFDATVLAPRAQQNYEVVNLDPLVFGTAGDESQ